MSHLSVLAVFLGRMAQVLGREYTGLPLLPEAVALATDVEHMAVMQQPVEDRRGGHRAAQQFTPLAEALVGGQDDAASLAAGRYQGEEGGGRLPAVGPEPNSSTTSTLGARQMRILRSRLCSARALRRSSIRS